MERRPLIVTLFRYPIHEHEALNNVFPRVLRELSTRADIHHFSFRSTRRHELHDQPHVTFHELPLRLKRQHLADKWIKTLLWMALMPGIALWCRAKKADMVYLEESMPPLGWLLALFSGRPTVMSGADIFWDVYLAPRGLGVWMRRLLAGFERVCWRSLHGVISRTAALRDHLVELGVPESRIRVVSEATEAHIFFPMPREEARAAMSFAAGDFIVGHHGLVQANKALDRIIRFMKPMTARHPALRLVIAGDGPERLRLEALARELSMTATVRFLGWLPGTGGLNTMLNACDVSLVNREGRFSDHFQVTANLLHSLSCGCTILSARLRGIAELVEDGRNGLLFDPDSEEQFRSQLGRLLADPELRRRLADEALQTARTRLSPDRVTADWTRALLDFCPGAT
jgi:glycosyltransferase involved in cell wall biosynthesis